MKALNIAGYSAKEEIANSLSHALGVVLSLIGLIYLLLNAFTQKSLGLGLSYAIYGVSLISLYLASTLYHHVKTDELKLKFKKLDHICIYYLIAGSYTPIMMNNVGGTKGVLITSAVWSIAAFGTYYKLFVKNQNKIISVSTYLVMGWLVLFFWPTVSESLSPLSLKLLIYGGLSYTGGVVFYLMKKVPYTHAIWHLCVLLGSVLHYFAIAFA
jgi:hemolysin III